MRSMSEHALATFLHRLLTDTPRPIGPVRDPTVLQRLVHQPAPLLQQLLTAHIDTLLADLPDGATLRPITVPATALWVGAILNNLVLATTRPDARLLTITLRLTEALPPATTWDTALAYHSLLRHLACCVPPGDDWQPVAHRVLAHSPLTALWLPYIDAHISWEVVLDLMQDRPLRALVHDRLLALLPPPEAQEPQAITRTLARANHTVGQILTALLEQGGPDWRPFVLAFYEADCERQRRGTDEHPTWPLLTLVRRTQRDGDAFQRRNAGWLLARYRPLAAMLHDETIFVPYSRLDGRFLSELGAIVSTRGSGMSFRPMNGRR